MHSPYTNLGSNQDPDDWYDQRVDREREEALIEWERAQQEQILNDDSSRVEQIIEKGLD